MWYTQCGARTGLPVLVFHGGPGGGSSTWQQRYFDPQRYRVVFYDQRGAGKSTPAAEVRENTTPDLIRDAEVIRHKVGVDRWAVVFGHSWGSTMALLYTQEYPQYVESIIAAGIWLSREKDLDWYLRGGAGELFPRQWAQFEGYIPQEERGNLVAAYTKRMQDSDPKKAAEAARRWVGWELTIAATTPVALAEFSDEEILSVGRFESHYFNNHSFISRDMEILRPKRLDRIKNIPTILVEGRYDMVCNPFPALELYRALKKRGGTVELEYVATGHNGKDLNIGITAAANYELYRRGLITEMPVAPPPPPPATAPVPVPAPPAGK